MKRRSIMIDQIIESEKGKELLSYVSPIYDNGYVALNLFNVLGSELDYAFKYIEKKDGNNNTDLKSQVVPNTATWSLNYWEQEYGLPTPLGSGLYNYASRRTEIINKMMNKVPMTPKRLAQMCISVLDPNTDNTNLVKILENTKENIIGRNTFQVNVDKEYLTSEEEAKLRQVIDKVKPAHLIYIINCTNRHKVTANIHVGATVAIFEKFEITVKQRKV